MDVRYITINEEDLEDLPIIDGQIIALADTPRWYYDMNDIRYNASGTLYCSMLPPVDKALNGVIYILDQRFYDEDSSEEDPVDRLDGAYLFLHGEYIKVSQLYNPASADELGLVRVGTNIDVTPGGVISISSSRIKAIAGIASTASAGLVRIGSGIDVTSSGIISVPIDTIAEEVLEEIKTDPTVFPLASTESVGVVRIGENIDVHNGLISVTYDNIVGALGYVPGASGTTASVGSENHPVYINQGAPSTTSYYLDIWTVGNGKAASYSTAEGNMTTASGQMAHAEGQKSYASGVYSHAEGYMSTASGTAAHAEGNSRAGGQYSHAGGYMSTASGDYSFAHGNRSRATGIGSAALGTYTNALGSTAIAIGANVTASTAGNVVLGNYSTATYVGQVVIGSRGMTVQTYNGRTFKSQYKDVGTSSSSQVLSTYVYGDNSLDYNEVVLGANKLPYPLTGLSSEYLVYTSQKSSDQPKPGDTKNRYWKNVTTFSFTYPEDHTPYNTRFPLVLNSGVLLNKYGTPKEYPWTPLMTRILAYESASESYVKYASTIISGLLATDVQPVVYAESYGPDDTQIVTLPDRYGSIVIFRTSYSSNTKYGTADERHINASTYYVIYYMMPSDERGTGAKAAYNYTYFGVDIIQLGAGKVGGSNVNALKLTTLNGQTKDDSTALHFQAGQFAFSCTQKNTYNPDTHNGVTYCVSAAVYSLPSKPAEFADMMQINHQ